MKFKGTMALTAAFIGLILYYFLIEIPTGKREKEEQARAEKVLRFEAREVDSLSIAGKEHPVSLKRTGDLTWAMTQPVQAPGDADAVESLLSFLKQLRFTRVVEESFEDPAVFGLDKPSLTLTLQLKNGKETGIRVGDDNPMGGKIYLSRTGEKKVLTARVARDQLDRSVYQLRDKTILEFNTSEITRLECARGGKTLTLEKQGDTWNLSEGEARARGDAGEIMNFLNTVRAARVGEFVEEQPESLVAFGLDRPSLRLTLSRAKSEPPASLWIGKQKDKGYYAKTDAGKNVFTIPKELFDTLNNSRLVDFMEKSLVDLKEDEVAALAFQTGAGDVRLQRGKEDRQRWNLTRPVAEPANTATVNSLLFDLRDTRIVEFVKTFVTDPEPFGLDRPQKKLVVTDPNGKDWSLAVGNPTVDGKHQFARRTGEEAVFTLKTADVEKIFRSLHDLKNRTLLRFDKDQVERIELRYPKKNFELIKNGKGWRLTQPETIDSVHDFIGNDILWTLASLEYESVVPAPPGETAPPRLIVNLWDRGDKNLGRLTVGAALAGSSELHYAQIGGKPEIYSIKPRFLDEIPNNINKFKDQPGSG